MPHVHGRHDHHHDHDGVAEGHRGDAELRLAMRADVGDPVAQSRLRSRCGVTLLRCDPSCDEVGVGAKERQDHHRGNRETRRCDEVGAGQLRQTQRHREATRYLEQVRAEDRADRGGPHHPRQVAGTPLGRREIGRTVPSLVVRGGGRADQETTHDHERERPHDGSDHDDDRAERPQPHADPERTPASTGEREPGERQGGQRRADDSGGLREPCRRLTACDTRGDERTRGYRAGHRDSRQHLVGRQNTERASLHPRDVDTGRRRNHRVGHVRCPAARGGDGAVVSHVRARGRAPHGRSGSGTPHAARRRHRELRCSRRSRSRADLR